MQRFYGGNLTDWVETLDPYWIEAYAHEMPLIQAEEQLRAIEIAAFGSPAQSDAEVGRRVAFIQRLQHRAQGQQSNIDAEGRDVLIGYDQISSWMNYWANQ